MKNFFARYQRYFKTAITDDMHGHRQAWWFFVAAAIFFAFIPFLWYLPYFAEKDPVLFGQVMQVEGDQITIKMRKQETVVVLAATSTRALATEGLVGQKVMFTIDGVRDEKRELTSLEILPERPRRP